MPPLPRTRGFDSSAAFLLDGYEFIRRRTSSFHSDAFATRLLLQRTICLTGGDAARVFYDNERFKRATAMPLRVQRTLVGEGGVQGLDGAEHGQRKDMFLSLLDTEGRARLLDAFEVQWRAAISRWKAEREVVLLDETAEVLCRSVFEWAGIPLREEDVAAWTRELGRMIDGAGAVGPRHWKARVARRRTESWLADMIVDIRRGRLTTEDGSVVETIANYRDTNGRLLSDRVAAVELLNVLRPVVAVNRFIVFVALALHSHRRARKALFAGEIEPEWFVHEVRRYYPFFPMVVARVQSDFTWRGFHFEKGTRTLLDLYGTNRDFRLWEEPDTFWPQRFADMPCDAYTFIPQGGGDYHANHRCAGEQLTVEIMKRALRMLTTAMTYEVPSQDMRVKLSRIPAQPESGFVIGNVRGADDGVMAT